MKHRFLPKVTRQGDRCVLIALLILLLPYGLTAFVGRVLPDGPPDEVVSFGSAWARMDVLDFHEWFRWGLGHAVLYGPACVLAVVFFCVRRKRYRVSAAAAALAGPFVPIIGWEALFAPQFYGYVMISILTMPVRCVALIDTVIKNTAHSGEGWRERYLMDILFGELGYWMLLWAIVLTVEIARKPAAAPQELPADAEPEGAVSKRDGTQHG